MSARRTVHSGRTMESGSIFAASKALAVSSTVALQGEVMPDGIYFSPHDNPRSICFYDFATRHTREIFRADKDLAEGMSISPDHRYMLYSQMDEHNTDIMLVDHFH